MAEKKYKMILKAIQEVMGSDTTTSKDLNEAGKTLLGGSYRGAFPSDKIPVLRHGQVAIANLDDSTGPGTHWIGIAQDKHKTIVYDSFGRKSSKIIPSVHRGGKMVIDTDDDAEQRVEQNNCGQRCLAALAVFEMKGSNGLLRL